MKKVFLYLSQLGFSELEAKIYISLLKQGPMTIKELAQITKLNRTAMYSYVNTLIERGIVIKIIKDSHKKFAAIEPERLHFLIDNKLDAVKQLDTEFPNIVHSINTSLVRDTIDQPLTIKHYKGKHNAKEIYYEAFKADTVCTFVRLTEKEGLFASNVVTFDEAFEKNKRLVMKEIIYSSPVAVRDAQALSRNTKNKYQFKIMPDDVKLDGDDILIYNGKLVIITHKGDFDCVVLQNANYYNNFKELFNFMWRMLPEQK
ncbi:MAG: helix-turn-helix domain-containing protein [Candidatus Levybacteria bacterium]|nr:helix-turn-helix domain-containing protein [Candidatus Levybacteria bacterium]